jgi:integrase/recombinase XerD
MKNLANLAALLQSFFTIRLITQRRVSHHTIASYRDTFRLLLQFAQQRSTKRPLNWH